MSRVTRSMRNVTEVLQRRPTEIRKMRTRNMASLASMDQNALMDACGLLTPKPKKPRKVKKPVACDKENLPEIKRKASQPEEPRDEKPLLCVMFDTESTGLGTKTAEIIQIAALPIPDDNHACGAGLDSFNRFLMPEIPIHWGASMVHKMKVREGRLVRHGQDVQAGRAALVLSEFFAWCCDLEDRHGGLLLVAHNGARFDFPLLVSVAQRKGVPLPARLRTLRLADSLPACRPCKQEFGSCKLSTLKENLVPGGGSTTHDALDDCRDLGAVLSGLAVRERRSVWQLLSSSGAVTSLERYQPHYEDHGPLML